MSARAFVASSLELIEAQYVSNGGSCLLWNDDSYVRAKLKHKAEEQKREPTLRQANKLHESRRALRRRILALLDVRAVYMPGLLQYLADEGLRDNHEDTSAEEIKVWLPSSIPNKDVHRVCGPEVVTAETKLQFARANDALDGLRHTLRVKTRMVLFKHTHIRGQRDSGHAREVINHVQGRAMLFVAQYRAARLAYYILLPDGTDLGVLPKLENGDVCGLGDPMRVKVGPGRRGTREDDLELEVEDKGAEEEEAGLCEAEEQGETAQIDLLPPDVSRYEYRTAHGTGETRKVNSWIWEYGQGRNKLGVDDGADDNNEILRAKWCKSRARLHRATEEVKLLQEEMKCALRFLDWAAARWDDLAKQVHKSASGSLREGRTSSAIKQARIQRRLRESFDNAWKVPLGSWDKREAVKEEEEERLQSEGGDASDKEPDEDDEDYGEGDYDEEEQF
ncbi:hypothetical protein V5O48_018583 [Marasmius crinis-equi]|uniref:Uncharacterized protein n=1 Tax=Marasmius crinis-equi TaxID=585013 RepID=A0ABR3EKU7_9AGAR